MYIGSLSPRGLEALAKVHLGTGIAQLGLVLRANSLARGPSQSWGLLPIHGFPEEFWTDSRTCCIAEGVIGAHATSVSRISVSDSWCGRVI